MIEHTFVTTFEPGDTMRAAADLLARRGFVSAAGSAFAVGSGEWNMLEMRRGKTAAKAKNIAQLPQVAHVQWDRGRVTAVRDENPDFELNTRGIFGGRGFIVTNTDVDGDGITPDSDPNVRNYGPASSFRATQQDDITNWIALAVRGPIAPKNTSTNVTRGRR